MSSAGAEAAREAAARLDELREEIDGPVSSTLARRVLRDWLGESPIGRRIEELVAELLAGGS